ncbi:TPM domain-containing protein [Streptomyces sp. NPDC048479]|uniref:TPM domain-containing protein n=1 Tax=Streptomyces sp. NPDC048479 TaxID=3154725 RepID=UPI00343678F8
MTRIAARLLLALLVAACWLVVPAARCALADGPVGLSRESRITDRVGGLGDRKPQVAQPVPAPASTAGEADPGGSDAAGTGADLVLPIAVVGGAVAIAAYTYAKRRKRSATRTTPQGGQEGWGTPQHPQPPLPELDAQAKQTLVDTDDALRTSQEELGFATAQFGEAAAKPFNDAVEYAKNELAAAFRLRRQLDDACPEDVATRRRMLDEIVARCTAANRRLDAESEDFDRLRALEQNAQQALATAGAAYTDLSGRAVTAEATLGMMRERYAASAAAPVASNVEQATDRLVFAKTGLDRAGQAVDASDKGATAVQIRAAEGAVAQARRLIESVDRRAQELAEAAGKLPGALIGTDADLAEARGLLKGTSEGVSTADLQGRVARAAKVAAEVRGEQEAGSYDPIDALRRVEEADAALDEALAGARENEQGARRARVLLDQAMLGARSAIGAAADYITTHRGAVGSEARTRLAEAERRLERAVELAGSGGSGDSGGSGGSGDPRGGLAEAQQADALARRAQNLAEEDLRAYGNPFGPGGVQGAGNARGGLGGAVLGGIILGGLFDGGGRSGGYGGGSGGGRVEGFGGGFGGGPARFGGGGTRGRLGGGRF